MNRLRLPRFRVIHVPVFYILVPHAPTGWCQNSGSPSTTGEVMSIDESWLSTEPGTAEPATGTVSRLPPKRQKKIIEAALAETRGRVSGPSGAASKLGIPSTTLESRIRSLKINKHRFKALD
jgi:DNA-binding NtrC family response regulator